MSTTELHLLKPSTQDPIPANVLRTLPLGGVYHMTDDGGENWAIIKLLKWEDHCADGFRRLQYMWRNPDTKVWAGGGLPARAGWVLAENVEIRYPLLPAVTFTMSTSQMRTPADTPSGRAKWVTRRRNIQKWMEPGALFQGWDQSFRVGKGKARGLGVFRVTSAETQGRWTCPDCDAWLDRMAGFKETLRCRNCDQPWKKKGPAGIAATDTLTPAELAAEGFPNMDPDEFWSLLEGAGNVRDGTVVRIAFEKV